MPIVRNSFIQMSKLSNLKGRINYISSYARQENLYAVYETTDRKFWTELARHNQEEFRKSGSEGQCIEARELIIALPESFVDYEPDKLLKLFTEHFKQNYGVECIAALHHNKRKTNYHIHLIFSERKLLDEPVEKIAKRNMFYDENGKHVRTKKEILDEAGQIRYGCRIIPKGKVYEREIFSVKDSRFKSDHFLDEVKRSYTDLINLYAKDDKERLHVFDRNGIYLQMKKIGKNNPKAEQIERDNEVRAMWNETVDRALISGVPENEIMKVKQTEINQKVKTSIQDSGRKPALYADLIRMAIFALEVLITKAFKVALGLIEKSLGLRNDEAEKISIKAPCDRGMITNEKRMDKPVQSILASNYPRLSEIHDKLDRQNQAIFQKEKELSNLNYEMADMKGIFKGKKRKELQGNIDQLQIQIENMKKRLSHIVQENGYKNMGEFLKDYMTARAEYSDYKEAVIQWENQNAKKKEEESIAAILKYYEEQSKQLNDNERSCYRNDSRGSR